LFHADRRTDRRTDRQKQTCKCKRRISGFGGVVEKVAQKSEKKKIYIGHFESREGKINIVLKLVS
jgi:hypothetical protein